MAQTNCKPNEQIEVNSQGSIRNFIVLRSKRLEHLRENDIVRTMTSSAAHIRVVLQTTTHNHTMCLSKRTSSDNEWTAFN